MASYPAYFNSRARCPPQYESEKVLVRGDLKITPNFEEVGIMVPVSGPVTNISTLSGSNGFMPGFNVSSKTLAPKPLPPRNFFAKDVVNSFSTALPEA